MGNPFDKRIVIAGVAAWVLFVVGAMFESDLALIPAGLVVAISAFGLTWQQQYDLPFTMDFLPRAVLIILWPLYLIAHRTYLRK
jgi:hypothetical protein